jgi:glycosyltransferase involved in cell wall biosynthesis
MKHKAVILHSEVHKDWSGEPIRVLEEASGMAKRGYHVIIASPPGSELEKRAALSGLTTEPIIMKKWRSYPYSLIKAMQILIRHRVDIVNTHASYDSWIFSLAAKLLKKKLIRTRHMSIYGSSFASRFIYRLPDFIITCSGESGRQELIRHFRLNPDAIVFIPSCPDLKKFNPDTVPAPVDTFRIRPGEKVIGMVASMSSYKGHAHFIDAMPHILRKSNKKMRFLLVGNGDSPLLEEYKKKTRVLGVDNHCIFAGHRDDIPEMLSLMDIFLLPSIKTEGTPQVLMQAMAMRLPVVSSPVGGIPELLGCPKPPVFKNSTYHPTPHGLLIPLAHPEALADAVLHLLERPELCQDIGVANRARIMDNYSREIMLDKTEKIYLRLCDDAGHDQDTL